MTPVIPPPEGNAPLRIRRQRSPKAKARRRSHRRRITAGFVAIVGVTSFGFGLIIFNRLQTDDSISHRVEALQAQSELDEITGSPADHAARPVYRHSVVPGGVRSPLEVEQAMMRDPVVAEHYASVQPATLHRDRLQNGVLAHVSYRIGDKVYWTKKALPLPTGEPVLTDGQTTIRERCGNIISVEPLAPSSDNEPPVRSFDLLVDPAFAWQPLEAAPPSPRGGTPPPPGSGAPPSGPPWLSPPPPSGPPFGTPAPPPNQPPGPTPTPPIVVSTPTPTPTPTPPVDPPTETPTPTPTPPETPTPVPEPGTFVLVGIGGALGFARYLQRRRK